MDRKINPTSPAENPSESSAETQYIVIHDESKHDGDKMHAIVPKMELRYILLFKRAELNYLLKMEKSEIYCTSPSTRT